MSAAAAAAVAANLVTASAPLLMGGEQSAFRSLVPSASSAAVALLAGLRQHQQNQMNVEREYHRRRVSCSSGSEKEDRIGSVSDFEDEKNGECGEEVKKDRNGNIYLKSKRTEDVSEVVGGTGNKKTRH